MNILFQTISSLTGGLITDISTLLVALLALSFVVMGVDYLRDILESTFSEMSLRKQGSSAGRTANEIDDDIESSRADAKASLYQANLKKYGRR